MVLDYSKWDALELSDDSDIEVHPNVDKRSFIRAKQAQIHQEREQRRHQIATLKYEKTINDGLMLRIDRLLAALRLHRSSSQSPDELVFQALIESAGDPSEDQPPPPPAGVHTKVADRPTYSKMMAALVDQCRSEVDTSKTIDRYDAFIKEITAHRTKVEGLQNDLLENLEKLEHEEHRHITSDDIHFGFDYSSITHEKKESKPKSAKPTESVELLNPETVKHDQTGPTDSDQFLGADENIEDNGDDDDTTEVTKLGKAFAKIPMNDFRACHQFITQHPQILSERETDGLLVEAFSSELDGKHKHAQTCVHHGLLIQYCRSLGADGVALFFKRITTKGHQAEKLFNDDVRDTYNRIMERAATIKEERKNNPASEEAVEQIQLHAVDPNTTINIMVPPLLAECLNDEQKRSREMFDSFPLSLQQALESQKLDDVNKVLAKMSVEEAEEVVSKLGESGMLSLEEGVIDATTEDGKRAMEEIERTRRMPGMESEKELASDPE